MPKRKTNTALLKKFQIGDAVRVRHGVMDEDYPDLPIGGWAGTIHEIQEDDIYTVHWTAETLAAVHAVFKKRSERDGSDFEQHCLGGDKLELDSGGPLDIQHPTQISTKPLSPNDEDDRIRMVFNLKTNDPLPNVDLDTLAVYRNYFYANLEFPFMATYSPDRGGPEKVKVVGLGDADNTVMVDDLYGILCEARIGRRHVILPLGELEVDNGKHNRQLIADYSCWFWNWR